MGAPIKGLRLVRYLAHLNNGRLILWCYFVWYLVVLVRYFDPTPGLWLTSLGLSLIIGFALLISTTSAGANKVKLDQWQIFRLFLTPFCVSSFAALVKGRGFFLVFSPRPVEDLLAVALCSLLCGTVFVLRRQRRWPLRPRTEDGDVRSTPRSMSRRADPAFDEEDSPIPN